MALQRWPALIELLMAQCRLTPRGLIDLLSNLSLEKLDISHNEIDEHSVKAIARNEKLQELNVTYCGLVDADVDALTKLTLLRNLRLDGNRFKGSVLKTLVELKNLEVLMVSARELPVGVADKLSKLSALTTLILNDTPLSAAFAKIATLPNLEKLSLYNCQISDKSVEELNPQEISFTKLSISGNPISDAGVTSISRVPLVELDLYSTKITDVGVSYLSSSVAGQTLKSLSIAYTGIGPGAGTYISDIVTLSSLQMSRTSIGDEGTALFHKLTSLASLSLAACGIGDAGAANLSQIPNLHHLDLSNNKIGPEGAKYLGKMSTLRRLILSHNAIGDAGATAIAQLGSLNQLQVPQNGISHVGGREFAKLKDLWLLDVGANSLGDRGVEGWQDIGWLESLNIPGNNLSDVGASFLARITGLRDLSASQNKIGDVGATELAQCRSINSIRLSYNNVTDAGAAALGRIENLQDLYLNHNSISSDGAKSIAHTCPRLRTLDLQGNTIGYDGATAICEMEYLHTLSLQDNRMSSRATDAVLKAFGDRPIVHLSLSGNESMLPAEMLSTNSAIVVQSAYRKFVDSTVVKVPLREAKVMVVGEGGVGKTSLINSVADNKCRDSHEMATDGISIHHPIRTPEWQISEEEITITFWDFGGQDVLYGTHKLFLTSRCVYVVVVDSRRNEDAAVLKWLRLIRSHGGMAPAVIAANKADHANARIQLSEGELRGLHPNVSAIVPTSCNCDEYARGTISRIRQEIIRSVELLEDFNSPIPISWNAVRNALRRRFAGGLPGMTFQAFEDLCVEVGDTLAGARSEQFALLELLRALGLVVLADARTEQVGYPVGDGGGEVRSESEIGELCGIRVEDLTLLHPKWLAKAAFALVGSAIIARQNGEFALEDLAMILDQEVYPPAWHRHIVSAIAGRHAKLCLRIPGSLQTRYLLAEALPDDAPSFINKSFGGDLRLRYAYEHLVPGLMSQVVLQIYELAPRNVVARWKSGTVFDMLECTVVIRHSWPEKALDVFVEGPAEHRMSVLRLVTQQIDLVNSRHGETTVAALVPIAGRPGAYVDFEHLVKLSQLAGLQWRVRPRGAEDLEVTVGELLGWVSDATGGRPPAQAEPSVDSTEERLRALQRSYTGLWGAKVFWLAILTLLPLLVSLKLFELNLSVATVVYVLYHGFGIRCWAGVHRLTQQPELFNKVQRELEITKITGVARWTNRLSWVVLFLLLMTVAAKATLVFGETKLRVPLPRWGYDLLGVPSAE